MGDFYNKNIMENGAQIDLLYDCVLNRRLGAAAILADALGKTERADALMNIALVFYLSGDAAKSLEYVDLASAASRKRVPVAGLAPKPANYQNLRAQDADAELRPMRAEYADAFPGLAHEDIMIAGARIARAAGMFAKRDNYLSGLHGAEFESFKNGIKQ